MSSNADDTGNCMQGRRRIAPREQTFIRITLAPARFKSPTTLLFIQQLVKTKDTSKPSSLALYAVNLSVAGSFVSQKVRDAENAWCRLRLIIDYKVQV